MAWTSPRTWVANVTAITALALNTDLRDNLNYLKGLLDGTGGDYVVTPEELYVENDLNFALFKDGGLNPTLVADTNDWLTYSRASNSWNFLVGGASTLVLASDGKLTGTGFYESTTAGTLITSGSSQGFLHGLGAQPRYVFVWYGTSGAGNQTNVATPATLSVGATVRFSAVDSTNILVINNTAGSIYARVVAIL